MNFRIISHLLKTDWRCLCVPIIVLWVLLLLNAMPWLLHDPASFGIPLFNEYFTKGNVGQAPELAGGLNMLGFLRISSVLALVVPILLATVLGMHDQRWQSVSPIRPWQRFVAKGLALFLFIVLPDLLLGAAVAVLNGFSLPFVANFTLESGVLLMLGYGTLALFGRCCGSFWSWTIAAACLVGLVCLLNVSMVRFDAPQSLSGFRSGEWLFGDRPFGCVQALLSLVLVVVVPRLFRCRPGGVAGMAAAVGGLLAASYLTAWLAVRPALWDRSVVMDSVRPVISSEDVWVGDAQWAYQMTEGHRRLQGRVRTTDPGRHTFVKWQSSDLNAGRRPDSYGDSMDQLISLREALPAPLVNYSDSGFEELVDLGSAEQRPASVGLTGFVFRYRTLADLPIGENLVMTTRDDITTTARMRMDGINGRVAEVALKCPRGTTGLRYFLYLPKLDQCITMEFVYGFNGVSQGGIEWRGTVLEVLNQFLSKKEPWDGARLLVLQSEFLGTLSRDLTLPSMVSPYAPRSEEWMPESKSDFRNNEYYSRLRPNRPDPATCTLKEVSFYLRQLMALSPSAAIARDLEEYAPRFPGLFVPYSRFYHVAESIKNNVPESRKAEVISSIDGPGSAYDLVRCLKPRGWLASARDPLLACLDFPWMIRGYDVVNPLISAIASLEDPATYAALLAAYEESGDSMIYQVIRQLPGIAPELDKVVERVSRRLSPVHDLKGKSFVYLSDILREFDGPVSHGNADAFSKLIRCVQRPDLEGYLVEVGIIRITTMADDQALSGDGGPKKGEFHTPKELREYFQGKTPADFTYDPLARCWRPVSKTL